MTIKNWLSSDDLTQPDGMGRILRVTLGSVDTLYVSWVFPNRRKERVLTPTKQRTVGSFVGSSSIQSFPISQLYVVVFNAQLTIVKRLLESHYVSIAAF